MKKLLTIIAALSASAGGAHAENVTIYGMLDAGVWSQNRSTSGGVTGPVSSGRLTKYQNGGIAPSIIGFRGSEDLGGGLKANFNLENHFSTADGMPGFGLFGRQANIGLTGAFGTVTLGEQYTPAILAYCATEPRGCKESLSGLQPFVVSAATLNPSANAVASSFSHNAISYAIETSGVRFAVLYGIGEVAGNSSANRIISLGLAYSGGPFSLSTGYHTTNGSNGNKADQKAFVGGGYRLGDFTFKANYLNAKNYAVGGSEQNAYKLFGVGADWAATANQTVTVAYYKVKNDNVNYNNANNLVLSDDYSLSKRTTLYVQLGLIDAKSNADPGVTVLGNSSLVQGTKTTVFNAGVKHNF